MPRPRKLAAVRELDGNPSHSPIPEGVRLSPEVPPEPEWEEWLDEVGQAKAHEAWVLITSNLDPHGLLAHVDAFLLTDTCRVWARLNECERDIGERGITVMTERGQVMNRAVTMAAQLRTTLIRYMGDLGLTPAARDKLNPRNPATDGNTAFGV